MPTESISAGSRVVRLLFQDGDNGNVAAGATVSSGKFRLDGMSRLKGGFHCDQAPAAQYPRLSFSLDGTNYDTVRVLERDASQAGYAYRLDDPIEAPYVKIDWQQGATPADLRAFVYASAGGGGEGGAGLNSGAAANGIERIASDKDTQFSGAITAGEHETENLTGLSSSVGTVRRAVLLAELDLDYEVHFWGSDSFSDADSDADVWLGFVELLAADARQVGNAEAHWRYAKTIEIPYLDSDNSTELHVSLVPTSANKPAAGAGGNVTLVILFDPE